MYCKHCGKQIDNDSKFCLFCGGSIETTSPSIQNTPSTETIKTYALPAKKEIAVGIIMSAILCFVSAIVFFYFGVLQTGLISGLLGLWTITVSFVYIAIGIAILLTRKWAYDWGLGSAIINILFLKYSYSQNDSNLFLFLILVQIAIAILLYINREYFKNKANIHTTVAIEQEQIEQINDLAKLYSLITTKKKKLFGNNTTEILTLINNICKTQNEAIELISTYNKTYNSDLLNEIKKLATNYNSIKNNMERFIDLGIVDSHYPHNRII